MKPLILLANDDGVQARGIEALADAMAMLGDVLVVAPDRERSAHGHAFTMDRPLRLEELRPNWYSLDGTPVDCVYVGLLKLAPRPPSLVVAGINHGLNLGADVFYSGTIACAVEAAIRKIPAIAISLDAHKDGDFQAAASFAHALAGNVLARGLPAGTVLSVNVPRGEPRGYQWTRLGDRIYHDQVEERYDLRGRHYYWIGGPTLGYGDVAGSDCHAVRDGLVSVTPLDLDLTHTDLLASLPSWRLDGYTAFDGAAAALA